MRIAFFIDVFPRISNTFILNQITGLLERGHEVEIYARALGDFTNTHEDIHRYALRERVRTIPVPPDWRERISEAAQLTFGNSDWPPGALNALNLIQHGRDALTLVQLYTALSLAGTRRYDVVHCQFGKLGPSVLPILEARGLDEPLVVSFRGADLTRISNRRPASYRRLFRRGSLFLPVSENFRQQLVESGCPEEKTVVHHSGIRMERFPFLERRKDPGERTEILFIGRLTEKKGARYAIEAVSRLLRQGRDVKLTIVGDGEEREELSRLVSREGLAESVELVGGETQEQVIERLRRAHLLAAPSVTAGDGDQEGIPNVLKEAMATGIPVVATRHSGIPELVEDGKSGYLVAERDAAALAERLGRLMDEAEKWPAMGRAGRAKVAAEFDSDRLNDELVELYRAVSIEQARSVPRRSPKAELASQ